MKLGALIPLATLALGLVPAGLAAQRLDQQCEFLPGTRNWTDRTTGSGTMTFVSRPRLRCRDGRYIEADSAVAFSASGYTQLIGNVYFQDASQSLRAARVDYYDNLRRLDASEGVVLTDRQSGNVMTGERLTYYREMPPSRMQEVLTMTGGRPTARLHPEVDSAVAADDAPAPYEVEADWIHMEGDALFVARGDVLVDRDSLHAEADSLQYDRDGGAMDLQGSARLQQAELDLAGRAIRIVLPGEVIREVLATEDARLIGEELDLDAHTIRIFFTDDSMDRLVAVGLSRSASPAERAAAEREGAARPAPEAGRPAGAEPDSAAAGDAAPDDRAVARAESLVMRADSLDVIAPGERLERVIAVGRARAVSSARDSLNTPDTPELIRNDWIEGDTVVAHLRPDTTATVTATAPDAADQGGERGYVLETLEAMSGARTLYRMDPDSASVEDEQGQAVMESPTAAADTAAAVVDPAVAAADTTAGAPPEGVPGRVVRRLPVSYVEADRIRIEFVGGNVELMHVTGLRQGLYLQPESARGSRGGGRPRP